MSIVEAVLSEKEATYVLASYARIGIKLRGKGWQLVGLLLLNSREMVESEK